ncbi:MAG: TIGR01777 family protein [Chitinophagaceae bacterium]|nr:MAG: TIGR01777 family protein [Chitinophagaceae bacterium]
MKVTITGGTGLVGKALTKALTDKGYKVCILTRNPSDHQSSQSIQYAQWNINNGTIDTQAIQSADHIIHLAGAGVADKRWTSKYKEKILRSRVGGSKLLSDAIQKYATNLKSIVCASATGWYGADKGGEPFAETDGAAGDFLGEVCRQWEESMQPGPYPVAHIRTGIVLSNNGGAYPKLTGPVHFGIAPILGNGKQVISWIHISDLVRIYISAMETRWSGSFNAVAPTPVTNRYLIRESAKKMRGNFYIPVYVPAFILKIVIGGGAEEVLKSCTVSCEKVKGEGFTFQYPTLHSCLENLTKS